MTDRPLVSFHREAVEEIEAAIRWYANRSHRAAQRFVDELHAAVETIEAAPNRWPEFEGVARRVLLHRFPYLVIYRVTKQRIEVLAVAHGHQRPGYWRERME